MKSKQISAIIITNKVNRSLNNALLSVKNFDEVLLILTTPNNISNNDLLLLKKAHQKMKIIRYPKQVELGFDLLRNWAMNQASFDWIFFLDSDEVLVGQADQILLNWVKRRHVSWSASLIRSDWFWGNQLKYGEAGRQKIVRLLNRNQARFTGKIHEVVKSQTKPYQLRAEIWHYSHENLAQFWKQVAGYAQQVAKTNQPGKIEICLKLLTFPLGKLVFNLLLKSGWRDGWPGLAYAVMMSWHSLLVRLFQLENYYVSKNT